MQEAGEAVPVSVVLGRGAGELRALVARLERVEQCLETVCLSSGAALDRAESDALQEIDLVMQSTDALAGFLESVALAARADPEAISLAQALRDVPLRDLRARLGGAPESRAASGVADLF